MPRLPRVTAKVFASKANEQDIGQFGSALSGTKVYTSNIAQIQALPAYEQGYRAAVVSTRNYPTLQEMNGLIKTLSQQIKYSLDTGMPEWDSSTIYYTNYFCQVQGVLYKSLTNNNQGNNPTTDSTNWEEFKSGGGGNSGTTPILFTPLGFIGQLAFPLDEDNEYFKTLNGYQLPITDKTQPFLKALKDAAKIIPGLLAQSQSQWNLIKSQSIEKQCGKFYINESQGYIQLPCVVKSQGCLTLANISKIVDAGIPRIKGVIQNILSGGIAPSGVNIPSAGASGNFLNSSTSLAHTKYYGEVTIKTQTQYPNLVLSLSNFAMDTGFKSIGQNSDGSKYENYYKVAKEDFDNVQEENIQYPYFIQIASPTYSGSNNYVDLTNKPSINNVVLSGNRTLDDLGIQPAGQYLTQEDKYTLPVANATTLGGVKVDGVSIKINEEGTISTTSSSDGGEGGISTYSELPDKPSINNITLEGNKTLTDLGIQPAGQYLTQEDKYILPTASTSILGGVKVDGTTISINELGVISASGSSGGEGTSNYNDLTNKPLINNITLSGNLTLDELNIQAKGEYATSSDLVDLQEQISSIEMQIGNISTILDNINGEDLSNTEAELPEVPDRT